MTTNNKPPTVAAMRKLRAEYAAKFLAARERKKLTQEDAAIALGVHVNTVRNVERTGRASPSVGRQIAAVFGVNALPRGRRG